MWRRSPVGLDLRPTGVWLSLIAGSLAVGVPLAWAFPGSPVATAGTWANIGFAVGFGVHAGWTRRWSAWPCSVLLAAVVTLVGLCLLFTGPDPELYSPVGVVTVLAFVGFGLPFALAGMAALTGAGIAVGWLAGLARAAATRWVGRLPGRCRRGVIAPV